MRGPSTNASALPATWLTGAKVRLRPIEPGDARLLQRWLRVESTRESLRGLLPPAARTGLEWLARISLDPVRPSFIVQTRRGQDIGLGMLLVKDAWAEIRVIMQERKHWSAGYGLDAVRVLVDAAFRVFPLQRIEVRLTLDEDRVIGAYAEAGFSREGVLRASAWRKGTPRDEVLLSILHDEWMGWRFEQV